MKFDIILSICFMALGYAMIPQIIHALKTQEVKITIQTLLVNSIALTIITGIFIIMELVFSSLVNTITMMSWWILTFLKIRYG